MERRQIRSRGWVGSRKRGKEEKRRGGKIGRGGKKDREKISASSQEGGRQVFMGWCILLQEAMVSSKCNY